MAQQFHIGNLIKEKLKEKERSIAWLARKMSYDRSDLCKMLQYPNIPIERLRQISQALEYDFFKHYSNDLQGDIKKQDTL
jgi:lambda repressor-like predicted transcriptional regulator